MSYWPILLSIYNFWFFNSIFLWCLIRRNQPTIHTFTFSQTINWINSKYLNWATFANYALQKTHFNLLLDISFQYQSIRYMVERALKLFTDAWNQIKSGNLFDEETNNAFDYMIKNLWNTDYRKPIKADIVKNLSQIFDKARGSENPPPLFYVLVSLRDPEITHELQSLLIMDWIKTGASEESTYQIINFIETFAEKQIPIQSFISTLVKHIRPSMNRDMVEALSYMVSVRHPEYMREFLKKFLSFSDQDESFLKNFVNMAGRRAFIELTQIATPAQMNKIFKHFTK